MSENDTKNTEQIAAEMGHELPFFEAQIRRNGYSKLITVPLKFAKRNHLTDGRRVHVYIVPVDDSPEIFGGNE